MSREDRDRQRLADAVTRERFGKLSDAERERPASAGQPSTPEQQAHRRDVLNRAMER